jgi:hypothetical protein
MPVDTVTTATTAQKIQNAVSTYAPTVLVIGVGYFLVKKFILKKGSKRRRY